jgi:eukaryotic-like serine/threonine-protein kinase
MRTRRRTLKPPTNTGDLLAAFRAARLLSRRRLARLESSWSPHSEDVRARTAELVADGHLTAYQADQVLAGCAHRLLLGPYRILDRLGHGGQGKVYKAEHRFMKRLVALKVLARLRPQDRPRRSLATPVSSIVIDLRPGLPSRAEALRRFRGEVEALARLNHPHVVIAHDAAEARGSLYLVMEFIDGIDLGQLVLQTGPLLVVEACAYVRQAALALQYLHEQGMVHGDVKPPNLMRTADGSGRVKLLDLGLARLVGRPQKPRSPSDPAPSSPLAGTPDFMAPELAHNPDAADVRSDLYSLGCTFFYLLTGDVPFPGDNWTEKLLRHHLDRPPSVRDLQPEVPAEVTAMIRRLLAKEPAERYQTPAELVQALDEWRMGTVEAESEVRSAGEENEAAASEPTPSRFGWLTYYLLPRLKWAAAGMAAVLAGWMIALAVRSSEPERLPDTTHPVATAKSAPPATRIPVYCTVEQVAGKFATLKEAVAAAPDGATVTIHGDGILATPPLVCRGKSLTIRAATGSKPILQLAARGQDVPPWSALLTTDRPLILIGLTLRGDEEGKAGHLVYAERADLGLMDCSLEAPRGNAAVVCRNGTEVLLRQCRMEAGSAAVSVEVGAAERCRVSLERCTIRTTRRAGAALSVWAPERRRATSVELSLERNAISADRVAAFTALPAPVAVAARDNDFSFREALIGFAGCKARDDWQRFIAWQGQNNRYQAAGPWIDVEGEPNPLRGLIAWRALWPGEESGSRELPESSAKPTNPVAKGPSPKGR